MLNPLRAATGHEHERRAGKAEPAGRLAAAHGLVGTGRGWSADGIEGPVPAPGSCHYRRTSGGEVLPDPRCTLGASTPAVAQANIEQAICRTGGNSDSGRPPLGLTEALKYKLLVAYGIAASQINDSELDHLVRGSGRLLEHLQPLARTQPLPAQRVSRQRQGRDRTPHVGSRVCDHQATLRGVQGSMATNWTRLAD